jgi:succinate-semialdehyde dehydrogenase/glutarate-semialdehyde dehydrogenase
MDASDSSDAVAAALKAFPEFSATPARNRARMLRSYNDILLANKADFAAIIVAENGKPCKHLEIPDSYLTDNVYQTKKQKRKSFMQPAFSNSSVEKQRDAMDIQFQLPIHLVES